ncbi:NAD(P)-dependent oxidoreductase [Kribbella catacumbae]|uniref:NAD(P)-dependent oxidoreductase n=1 Tax=Kribbella catacumbae TaxID=460086 RepID=UPI00037C3F68|nr:NAD(P)H-binding protein [Kribbella catacumbae]
MRITVFGATGAVGSRVVQEALSRGHEVTAVSRQALRSSKDDAAGGLRVRRGDASDPTEVTRLSRGQDLVISATRPVPGREDELAIAAKGLVSGLAGTGVRLLIVGGAASLTLPGDRSTTVVDGPGFPAALRPIALACNEQLEVIRSSADLEWTYLSPPALLEPGVRTGTYRLGRDELLTAADGTSYISMEDFAIALLDEAERPQHHCTRFTVGY